MEDIFIKHTWKQALQGRLDWFIAKLPMVHDNGRFVSVETGAALGKRTKTSIICRNRNATVNSELTGPGSQVST